jgi:hypothetical protein
MRHELFFPFERWGPEFESHARHACLCVCLFCVCVVLSVGSGFAMGWSPVQGVLPTVQRIKKPKKRPRPIKRAQRSINNNVIHAVNTVPWRVWWTKGLLKRGKHANYIWEICYISTLAFSGLCYTVFLCVCVCVCVGGSNGIVGGETQVRWVKIWWYS